MTNNQTPLDASKEIDDIAHGRTSLVMPTIEEVRRKIAEEERRARYIQALREIGVEAGIRLTEYAAAFMQQTNLKADEIELVIWRDDWGLVPKVHYQYRRRSDVGNIEANNG